jgi:hypothetical protein
MRKVEFDHSPIEPVHPVQVRLYEDLLQIYSFIREKFQLEIDKAFDSVASQIGFVIATSIEVGMKFDKGGTVSGIIIVEGRQFRDTVIEKALSKPLKMIADTQFPDKIRQGEYSLHLFWFDALKIKLRTDWVEPAHHRGISHLERLKFRDLIKPELSKERVAVKPEVIEPVHWFDPGYRISADEAILVSVIDEVYSELGLVERISKIRATQGFAEVPSVVKEPVHNLTREEGLELGKIRNLLTEINDRLRRYGV